jgi:hypothetical protein
VILYLCDGVFSGPGLLKLKAPKIGARHKFLLFLRQEMESVSFSAALAEAERFGFGTVSVLGGNQLSVESLNSPDFQGFTKHYEEALSQGSSLVWYPSHEGEA